MENSRSELMVKDRRPDALGELRILPDELICAVLEYLCPRDVARLACVSSVMYIFCKEEPLWMRLCLHNTSGQLDYKGSWKKTLLHGLNLPNGYVELCGKPLHFDGFNSLFLYRRLYRCFTTLDAFSLDNGKLERKKNISFEEFHHKYDGQKPVLLTNLADSWSARSTWTTEQLLLKYRDTPFKLSQRSSRKITMKFKDYITYIKLQHDEDPLYIFDDKFGEVAPDLLKEYSVPHLFREDYFDVLGRDQRPPFRWLIIGPERSGASWHVDPALTSAWNTLLCGRKRWALYPPGRVPLGVTVHVNEEDGDVNVETPSSLQWWLDIYPLLAEEDKPIECTQFPGETIFVPSGWWHCVLNLETTVAVTQNFVNSKNFEFVCLDMAPGHCHKGVCRAGLLAVDKGSSLDNKSNISFDKSHSSYSDMSKKKKRPRILSEEDPCVGNNKNSTEGAFKNYNLQDQDFCYSIDFLSSFLDEERDHYNALWSASNSIGQREMREWLQKLWIGKPEIRELIWKGACLALNVDKWSARVAEICTYHGLPSPFDDEMLPVGTGSNPVYLIGDYVIKIYVEGGLMPSVHGLGTELEFYSHLHKFNSPLKDHIPDVLASGILSHENGSYTIVPWDGKSVPHLIAKCNLRSNNFTIDGFPFGVWSKSLFANREAGSINESASYSGHRMTWPFIITKRCKGNLFAHLRDSLLCENVLDLASFLGDQLRNLHLLPLPSLPDIICLDIEQKVELPSVSASMETSSNRYIIPLEWKQFIEDMNRKKKEITTRLKNWGHPIPDLLIEKVEEYIPDELAALLNIFKDDNGIYKSCKFSAWIHSDIMEDNIFLEPCLCLDEKRKDVSSLINGSINGYSLHGECIKWHPTHIIDFSDLSIGDRICDLIPIYLDVFRGDSHLLEHFLESYKLPLVRKASNSESDENWDKFGRLSYHAMCYCILHEDNILGAIFSLWKELRTAKSWEEVEETVWGKLNHYKGYN